MPTTLHLTNCILGFQLFDLSFKKNSVDPIPRTDRYWISPLAY
jgi:hypothetical protein